MISGEAEAVSLTVRVWKTRRNVELDGPRPLLERVWVRYFLSHRTLKIPSSINKPVSGSKIVGKTERKKALDFDT